MELGPHLTMWSCQRPTSVSGGIQIYPTLWPQQTSAENWGRGCATFVVGELGPRLTQYGVAEVYLQSIPSGILINPTV